MGYEVKTRISMGFGLRRIIVEVDSEITARALDDGRTDMG